MIGTVETKLYRRFVASNFHKNIRFANLMSRELKYGHDATVRIDVPTESILADCATPRGQPLDDPAAAVAAAVSNPLDFPPLTRATVPGDRIVLAVDHGVPQARAVIAGVVHTLLDGYAQPDEISIVSANGSAGPPREPLTSLLPAEVRDAIEVTTHDPHDSASLSYLASSREGQRICFNRTIFDADVVLPISTLRLDETLGYFGVHGGLFPTFSDAATIDRFRAPGATQWDAHQRRRRAEADEAAWLLGVQFTVQVTPGPGDSLLHVLAGEAHAVAQRGRDLCQAAWMHRSPQRASLVVATIEGGPEQQTWENFARALFSASRAVRDGGAIVLCTELSCPLGPALRRLTAAGNDDDRVMRDLLRDRSTDAVSAALLVEARQRAHVYLMSGLESDVVEDLGLGHVSDADEIERLSRRHDSCILLGNAQHAVLGIAEG